MRVSDYYSVLNCCRTESSQESDPEDLTVRLETSVKCGNIYEVRSGNDNGTRVAPSVADKGIG